MGTNDLLIGSRVDLSAPRSEASGYISGELDTSAIKTDGMQFMRRRWNSCQVWGCCWVLTGECSISEGGE